MSIRLIANSILAIGLLGSIVLVVALTDLAQWLYLNYETTFAVWKWKWTIAAVTLLAMVVGLALHVFKVGGKIRKGLWAVSISTIFCTVVGLYLHTYILFGAQPLLTQAKYSNFEQADVFLQPEDDVVVIEVNGAATGFPDKFAINPHVAGAEIGGQKLTMTYCGLSHLGQAFVPEDPDNLPNWGVMTNWANNLVMYDRNNGEPIQQITGTAEYTGRSMSHYPTFRLSYGNFKRAFPDGEVYFNPIEESPWWRKLSFVPFILFAGPFLQRNRDPSTEAMAFPIDRNDDRLHPKTQVYGVRIGGENVVYTKDFVLDNGGVVHANIGGRKIVVAYDADFDSVGAFYTSDNVKSVDVYGNSEIGKLDRVETFQSEVIWGVWQHFMTDTDINRIG